MSEPVPGDRPGHPVPGRLPPACATVDGDLVEMALGTLSGKARMVTLAHLDTCARCSAEVEALSGAADQLVLLAPEAEPPVGLEARVFERLGLPQSAPKVRPWPLRLPRRTLVAAAALVVLLVFAMGALAGHMAGPGYSPVTHDGPIELASMESNGKDVGNVMVYAGNPTWLFMYMYHVNWSGTLRCQVTVDDGPPVMLGRFWLSDGRGAWAESVSLPAGRLVQARVLGAHGQVLAVANLS
jgi:hypothetical protein